MDTESELNEVCEKLDQTLDGIMMTLEDILTCQAELDEYIKKGFLMMSKARYNIGLTRISSMQYNEDGLEEAATKVIVTEGKDSDVIFSLLQDDTECDDVHSSMLRHRKEQKENTSPEDLTESIHHLNIGNISNVHKETDEKRGTKVSKRNSDPLNWFGVLVPQALRQSQHQFKRATEQCCHLATLKGHLLKLRTDQEVLMKRKIMLKPDNNSEESTEELSCDESA